MMAKMIVVTGAPGSGKTGLSRFIAEKYGLPCLNKDDIKEILFDNLELAAPDRGQKYGLGSVKLLFFFAEKLLSIGQTFILESNFDNHFSLPYFLDLQTTRPSLILQVVCHTEFETLYQRFKSRSQSGNRHPGHQDQNFSKEDFRQYLQDKEYGMPLSHCQTITLDTTHGFDQAKETLGQAVQDFLSGRGSQD